MGKVLVVGLDGASLDLIRPWAAQGKLPTFARLLSEGASGPLRSTVHPYTAQAWTTMVTGVNAGRHRLFDFWERDLESYGFHLTNAGARAAPAIWSVLSERGRRVVVVNVPMTFPPEGVNGVLVSGRDTPGLSSEYAHPASVKEELEKALARPYVIVPNDWRWMRLGRPDKAREALLQEAEVRFAATRHLMETREWDFCMFVVGATDGAAHFFWRLHDPEFPGHDPELAETLGDVLLEVYQQVDQLLADLLQAAGDEVSLMIVSDHGSGSSQLRAIHLNRWLAQHGWLHFEEADSEPRTGRWMVNLVACLKQVAYSLIPYQQLNRLRQLWPDRWRKRLSRLELFAGVDWSRTQAFSEERRGSIWINLAGREPEGIVPQADYEALRDEIAQALERASVPWSDEPLVRRVWRREELFAGPYTDRIPDLLIELKSPSQFHVHKGAHHGPAVRPLTEREIAEMTVTGDHRMEGTLILHGAGVQPGATFDPVDMRDVLPTALYLMGEAIPAYAEGRLVEAAFEDAWLAARPPVYDDTDLDGPGTERYDYSSEETDLLEERLEGLGYLG